MLPLWDEVIQQEFILPLANLIQTSCVYCTTAAALGPRRVIVKIKMRYTISLHTLQMSGLDQRKIYWCSSSFCHIVSPLSLPCLNFCCVRGLGMKSVSFMKYSCLALSSSCQEQGMVGWPCSSDFREEENVGAKDFEKGALDHRNAWPKCTNFLLSNINKLLCLAMRVCWWSCSPAYNDIPRAAWSIRRIKKNPT